MKLISSVISLLAVISCVVATQPTGTPSCDWVCPTTDKKGNSDTSSSDSPPYARQTFDCFYRKSGGTEYTCEYSAWDGKYITGYSASHCPSKATHKCTSRKRSPLPSRPEPAKRSRPSKRYTL